MGQYIQYGADGGMVRKNTPGAIWAHGKYKLGNLRISISEMYTFFSWTPILRFQTSDLVFHRDPYRKEQRRRFSIDFSIFVIESFVLQEAALAANLFTAFLGRRLLAQSPNEGKKRLTAPKTFVFEIYSELGGRYWVKRG